MKAIMALLVTSLLWGIPAMSQRKLPTDSVDVTIRLKHSGGTPITDSVLVIFDRYDHSGAGIIKRIYHPVNNEIVIPKVPPARYYIEVAFLGVNQDRFNELTYVNNRRSNIFTYRIRKGGTFTPGLVIIPLDPINFNKLKILEPRITP
ncbi:hypothetical protein [Paraflavitalea sp. CAU 1676]|uniref:hypothetical protein n=1 Tax=Paraflavitalea sp. CAU 1676 TaxID=3032598 RepID=UPI0023D9907E|nr:hypothetical protein [Paraflavitalea sp. CAU 1676]MDF2192547.1 hypothetical protein [Paraflavitalea sp. CAU 1676]